MIEQLNTSEMPVVAVQVTLYTQPELVTITMAERIITLLKENSPSFSAQPKDFAYWLPRQGLALYLLHDQVDKEKIYGMAMVSLVDLWTVKLAKIYHLIIDHKDRWLDLFKLMCVKIIDDAKNFWKVDSLELPFSCDDGCSGRFEVKLR